MRRVGETGWELSTHNTCQHQGRVFHLSQDRGKLRISELLLGDNVRWVNVITHVACKADGDGFISCCSMGENILLMSGKSTNVFACLIRVGEGPLKKSSIHIVKLATKGVADWPDVSFLCSVSETRALLYFHWRDSMWYCDVEGAVLTVRPLATRIPAEEGFCTVPLRLPDGKLLVAGSLPPSTDITIISTDGEPTFRRVGTIPGEKRFATSTVLIAERFVVGFGGCGEESIKDLWVFDLQTSQSSPVCQEGDWHPEDSVTPLIVQQSMLYLIGGEHSRSIHSISLQDLSELIQDADIQAAFKASVGSGESLLSQPEPESENLRGMKGLDGFFPGFYTHNTTSHEGRVFHFSQDHKNLCVTEILFGRHLRTKTVNTGVECMTGEWGYISCCSLGERILVLAGTENSTDAFCCLLKVDPGKLSEDSIHLETKPVKGWRRYWNTPFLAKISEDRFWASFRNSDEVWFGEIEAEGVLLRKSLSNLPTPEGFGTVPIRLPDGRFLLGGARPRSRTITFISIKGDIFVFQKAGKVPGQERHGTPTVLIGKRFVVGFGGCAKDPLDELWIFDIQTRKTSLVRQEGDWHPATHWALLEVQEKTLYLVGGYNVISAHSIPLKALADLIEDKTIRATFSWGVGLPLPLDLVPLLKLEYHYVPGWL